VIVCMERREGGRKGGREGKRAILCIRRLAMVSKGNQYRGTFRGNQRQSILKTPTQDAVRMKE